jgi:hypothetical protein
VAKSSSLMPRPIIDWMRSRVAVASGSGTSKRRPASRPSSRSYHSNSGVNVTLKSWLPKAGVL